MNEDKEHILWEAYYAINTALDLVGKEELIDYLSEETRQKLFEGYVLQEDYDTLSKKYDICKMSGNLLKESMTYAY